jgi:hypothetical protein
VRPPREKIKPPRVDDRRDTPSGGTWGRPPRDIVKRREDEKKKEKRKEPYFREKRKDFRRPPKEPVKPVIIGDGGCYFPPGHRYPYPWYPPYSYVDIDYVFIHYDYTYICQPVVIPELMGDEIYGISLPFGPIVPWEVGELYLIRLKSLEEKGLGGTLLTSIVQTNEEMGWEQFLVRYQSDITDVVYYGRVGRTSFLVGMTVSDILDLMVNEGIRWVGEFYPEYKIVPGGRNSKFYVRSLEGDTVGFRRELRDVGVFVMGFDRDTQEYYVRSSQDTYDEVAKLWWVARVSGSGAKPFFQPEYEYLDVGMAP